MKPAASDGGQQPARAPSRQRLGANWVRWLSGLFLLTDSYSADDEAAFTAYRRRQQVKQAAVVTAIIGLGAGLFWPTDFLTFADRPALFAAFAAWRSRVLGTAISTLILLRVVRGRPLLVLALVDIAGAAALLFVTQALSRFEDGQHLWFAYFCVAPFASVPLTLTLRERAAMAVTVLVAPFVGFFLTAPTVDTSRLIVDIIMMSFTTMASVLMGQLVFGLTRANFMQSRQLLSRTRALEEADRVKSEFFANVSHELRTPLTLILGAFRQLDRQVNDRAIARAIVQAIDAPAVLQATATGRRNAARLLVLINELLDLSAYDAGRRPSKRTVDVAAELKRTVGAFESVPERVLSLHGTDGPLLAEVDPLALKKVIYNLLSNAIKFTGAGGRIRVMLGAQGERFEIAVEDDGPGIAQADQARIFERFVRLGDNSGRNHEGTGIGLALVKQVVEAHDGQVRVRSRPGQGATFTITLPVGEVRGGVAVGADSEGDDGLPALLADAESTVPRGQHGAFVDAPADAPLVLVVDDNEGVRDDLTRSLRARYRVATAEDGQRGLAAARSLHPSLVVTDSMMPVMGGRELVMALRADAALAQTPILMLSARAGTGERVETLRAGANDYVVKPFEEEELIARIESLLLVRRQREVIARHRDTLEITVAHKTAELHRLAEHLLSAREVERAHIAREVHDELGGLFTAMLLETDRLAAAQSSSAAQGAVNVAASDVTRLVGLIDRAMLVMRAVVADLRPRSLDELGFVVAVEQLFAGFEGRTAVPCVWEIDPPDFTLDGERALVAYRVLQESLTNVARHAHATLVEVMITREGDHVSLEIRDDGVGLPSGERAGFGLLGMRERVQSVGGSFEASRGEGGKGTRIRARFGAVNSASGTTA